MTGEEPCPWCKGTKLSAVPWSDPPGWAVGCRTESCMAEGPIRKTVELAVEAWNEVAGTARAADDLEDRTLWMT